MEMLQLKPLTAAVGFTTRGSGAQSNINQNMLNCHKINDKECEWRTLKMYQELTEQLEGCRAIYKL